jgi:hypothetical protein
MPTLKYHGLVILNNDLGQLRFGLGELIGSCQSWVWIFNRDDLSKSAQEFIKHFDNRTYWQCAAKSRDTVLKLSESIHKLSNFSKSQIEVICE